MKKKQLSFFCIHFLFVCIALFSQGREAFSYVTQIRIEARNNLVRLTWVDSPDARGPVYIFRSTRPFSGSIPANIRPITVRYGVQYYIDDIDDIENIYYFIAASDTSGRRYDIIIPQTNSSNVNLSMTQTQIQPQTQAAASGISPTEERGQTMPSVQLAQRIYNLRADSISSADGDGVVITFDIAGPEKNAVLYRSMQPLSRSVDLLNAVIIQSRVRSPFVDYPLPGFFWYYAVIYEDEISGGNIDIRPGSNATVTGINISGEQMAEQSMRPIPLPMLGLANVVGEGYFLPEAIEQIPLSPRAESMLRDARITAKAPHVLKTPRVFVTDLESPSSGEESTLFQIVNDYFCFLDWENARISLQYYLSLPRSKEVEARARFYLGQTFYYTVRYREALLEFLSIRSLHPAEANSWIEAILSAMVY